MKTAEEIARHIRYRQRESDDLPNDQRRSLLAAEIEHACKGLGTSEKRVLFEELDRFFPMGIIEQAAPVSTVATAPPARSWEELADALGAEVSARPENERRDLRSQITRRLGLEPAPPPPPVLVAREGELDEFLQVFKQAHLLDPDPVLNNPLGAFSARYITDLVALAGKLNQQADPVSRFLWQNLEDETRNALSRVVLNQKRTSSDLDRCRDTLVEDLDTLLRKGSVYESQRFARVQLSEESRRSVDKKLSDRALVRFNQSLLEDAYPEEIRCQTTEREFVESTIKSLRRRGKSKASLEVSLNLAAVSLIELGCLEQFARVVLKDLNKRIFDPVHGRLVLAEFNEMGAFLARFLAEADEGSLAGNLRVFTGLIKCLLESYQIQPVATAGALVEMDPDRIEKKHRMTGWTREVQIDYEQCWAEYRAIYKRHWIILCEGDAERTGGLSDEEAKKRTKEFVKQTIERMVTARVHEKYGWKLKEEG